MSNEIQYDVAPGYYLEPFTVNILFSPEVESLRYSVNGGAPSISKYVAYDTLVPPNPFIAVTEDGTGNVVYDGGFPKFYNSFAPSVEIKPFDHAIRLQGECTSANTTLNSFVYCRLSDKRVDVVAGDKLVYDMWGTSDIVMAGVDGLINGDIEDALRDSGIPDSNGLNCHPTTDTSLYARNKWYHRSIDLTPHAGKYIDYWMIVLENNVAGVHVAYFKEIYVVDSTGAVKETLYKDVMEYPVVTLADAVSVGTNQQNFINYQTRDVDVRDQLIAAFKYFNNALRFCVNKEKVAAGNKKVLVIGDATSPKQLAYRVKGTDASDFNLTLSRLFTIAGYIPTFKDGLDWNATTGVIDPTLSELEQYVAVVFFSTIHGAAGDSFLVSDDCVDNMLTFRENGNGLIFITDHGADIPTIEEALSINSTGFFRSANKIITGFGAWFSGNYDRVPVNVGFLRANYGDHPLYDSMLDSESIAAGVSESRVNVAEFDPVFPGDLPPVQIVDGRNIIQIAASLADGSVATSRAIYYVVSFKVSFTDGVVTLDNGQTLNTGVKSQTPLDVLFDGDSEESVQGVIYKNSVRIGEITWSREDGLVQTFDGSDSNIISVDDNDGLRVTLTAPLTLNSAITVKRFQPSLTQTDSLSELMGFLREYKPELTDIKRVGEMIKEIAVTRPELDLTQVLNTPINLKVLTDYFNNEL